MSNLHQQQGMQESKFPRISHDMLMGFWAQSIMDRLGYRATPELLGAFMDVLVDVIGSLIQEGASTELRRLCEINLHEYQRPKHPINKQSSLSGREWADTMVGMDEEEKNADEGPLPRGVTFKGKKYLKEQAHYGAKRNTDFNRHHNSLRSIPNESV